MMNIPPRYEAYFKPVILHGRLDRWQCVRCKKHILPNNGGAQSHVAYHVRQRERETVKLRGGTG